MVLEREGKDGVVVTVGPMLDRTLSAVADMDLTVLYATTVTPFDEKTFRNAVIKASPNIVLIEPYYEGGLVPNITRALQTIPARVAAIGVPLRVLERYGPPERHDQAIGLTAEGIHSRIKSFLNI
jgi:transketolase